MAVFQDLLDTFGNVVIAREQSKADIAESRAKTEALLRVNAQEAALKEGEFAVSKEQAKQLAIFGVGLLAVIFIIRSTKAA